MSIEYIGFLVSVSTSRPFRKVFEEETRERERSGMRGRLKDEQQQRKAMARDGTVDEIDMELLSVCGLRRAWMVWVGRGRSSTSRRCGLRRRLIRRSKDEMTARTRGQKSGILKIAVGTGKESAN